MPHIGNCEVQLWIWTRQWK